MPLSIVSMSEPVLSVENVRRSYGRFSALNGVSFSVQPCELFGLLGPNGAGKTTLLSILAGLNAPTSGEVRLFGKPFHPKDLNSRRLLGLATQDLAIYPELTAAENLTFFGKLYGLRGSDLAGRVKEMLGAVELLDRADQRTGTFSGGMKRRLNLAVALVHRPKILMLDEPTTGVDPQSRNHIFEMVKAQNAAGLTALYTSHYMEEVETLCPRLAILDGGRVLACDELANLLRTLDSTATVQLEIPNPELAEKLRVLPGVKSAELNGPTLIITAMDLAPLLPQILTACGAVKSLAIQQPTLERVFLNLTGKALRD